MRFRPSLTSLASLASFASLAVPALLLPNCSAASDAPAAEETTSIASASTCGVLCSGGGLTLHSKTRGDVDGDGKADIVVVGVSDTTIPVGISTASGNFTYVNAPITGDTGFGAYAKQGPHVVLGDFDGDGRADIALAGGTSPGGAVWGTIPVAYARAGNTFAAVNSGADGNARLTELASRAGTQMVASDVNADGKDDLVIVNASGVTIGLSKGSSFTASFPEAGQFAQWAMEPGAKLVAGDFDHDGRGDFALTGGVGWTGIPVAFSTSSGLRITNLGAGGDGATFAGLAAEPGAAPVAADFDGDGKADLALAGGPGWTTVPVATSKGDGTFVFTNRKLASFPAWATQPMAQPAVVRGPFFFTGDFDGDGKSDLALTGATGWSTIPVAQSVGAGQFGELGIPLNHGVATIPGLTAQASAIALSASALPTTLDTCDAITGVHVERNLASQASVSFTISQPARLRVGALRYSFASYPDDTSYGYYSSGTYTATLSHLQNGVEYWVQVAPVPLAQSNGVASCGPMVHLPANACGANNQACCDTGTCNAGMVCLSPSVSGQADPICQPCGGKGQYACTSGAACGDHLAVSGAGICMPCGTATHPACGGTTCDAGLTVNGAGTCVECGYLGEPSCNGTCYATHTWDLGGTCKIACGGPDQHCCNGDNYCQPGLTCSTHWLFPNNCVANDGGGTGGISFCSNGAIPQTYSTCTTCGASGPPMTDSATVCSMDDAIAYAQRAHAGNDCVVYPGACH